MKAINLNNQRELATNLAVAGSMFSRMRGLLGKDSLPPGEALLIKPCNGIHTFGMRFVIDVVFLDRKNHVVALSKDLRPNHITPIHFRAACVIELPAGTVETTGTQMDDEIEIV